MFYPFTWTTGNYKVGTFKEGEDGKFVIDVDSSEDNEVHVYLETLVKRHLCPLQ